MPFRKLILRPGENLEQTPTLNQTQFASTTLCRFYNGLIQKLGGWQQLSADTLVGVCRGLWGWADLVGNPYLGAGTDQRLMVLDGGVIEDITPVVQTDNLTTAFSTTLGSPTVSIADAGYSPSAGDWVNIATQVSVGGLILFGLYLVQSGGDPFTITAAANATATVAGGGTVPAYTTTNGSATVTVVLANHGYSVGNLFDAVVSTTVGGLTIAGVYSVASVVDANTFTITAPSAATSGATVSMNSGAAQVAYLLPSGYAVATPLTGYGTGAYGAGEYGIGGSGQVIGRLRQWSLSNWGQSLIASPTDGAIYYWTPPNIAPAVTIGGTSPTISRAVFVMSQAQIMVALGAETGGTQEPLLVRWCNAGDFTDWVASTINQAGSFLIPAGSTLVGGLPLGLGAVLWTDVGVWSMSYLGFPLVFGFNQLAVGCGLIAQRAAGTTGSVVMWLSTRGFFQMQVGGGVAALECPVWDFLFNNLDTTQVDQIHCAVNSLFNEMAWFFPISTSSPIYSAAAPIGYVKYNYVERCWDSGLSSQYQRTAWVGRSAIGNPVGADSAGILQQHEVGFDANGVAMVGGWQTGYFDLLEGEEFAFVDLLLPDFVLDWTGGPPAFSFSLLATDYPIGLPDGSADGQPLVDGPYVVSTTQPGATLMVACRIRARQVAISVSWSDLGTFNRLGAVRYRFAPDGRN